MAITKSEGFFDILSFLLSSKQEHNTLTSFFLILKLHILSVVFVHTLLVDRTVHTDKNTVQYFAGSELLSHVSGERHPASLPLVAAEKDVMAFSEAEHLQSCGAFLHIADAVQEEM